MYVLQSSTVRSIPFVFLILLYVGPKSIYSIMQALGSLFDY